MLQIQSLFHNGDQHVSGYGDPHLCLDCVFGRSVKRFDSKVLFDPLEEQLDLPSLFVQRTNCDRWQCKVVGEKLQGFVGFWICKSNASKSFWISLGGVQSSQANMSIADQAGTGIDNKLLNQLSLKVVFGPLTKKALAVCN